jgi:hypothetical protein
VVVAGAGLVLAFGSAAASAAITPLTIDSRSPALEAGPAGGWTVSLGFTNLSTKPIALAARPSNDGDVGCSLMLDRAQLPPAGHSDVKVTVPGGCKVANDGIDFTVSAKAGATSRTFEVTAAPKPDSNKPEWSALWAFPVALGGLLVVALLLFGLWAPSEPLKYLEATWSFKDSWVSNVTVLGGLLAGIFGSSDVVTALLGKDAKSSIALATVGAAIAAAFIAAGPIVLLTTKSRRGDFVTPGGFLLASAITLSGAAGELWVVYRSGEKLDLGGWQHRIVILALAGFVLLALYAIRTVPATIKQGTTEPPAAPPSDTIKAANLIVAAIKAQGGIGEDQFAEALQAVDDRYPAVTAPSTAQPLPRRTALL